MDCGCEVCVAVRRRVGEEIAKLPIIQFFAGHWFCPFCSFNRRFATAQGCANTGTKHLWDAHRKDARLATQ